MTSCFWNSTVEPTDDYSFFIFAGTCTIIFNAIVMLMAVGYVDTNEKPSQIFVIHMTTADIITGIVAQLIRPVVSCFTGYYICGPYYILAWTSQMSSVANLLWLNIDKFIYIQYPLKRTITIAIITWILLLIINSFNYYRYLVFRQPNNPSCIRVQFDPLYSYMIITAIAYILPIIVCFIISINIFVIAQRTSQKDQISTGHHHSTKNLVRRIFFVFISTLWTCFTCLPYRVSYIIYALCSTTRSTATYGISVDYCANSIVLTIITLLFKLMQLTTVGNPIITVVTQRVYRRQVITLFTNSLLVYCRRNRGYVPTEVLSSKSRCQSLLTDNNNIYTHKSVE